MKKLILGLLIFSGISLYGQIGNFNIINLRHYQIIRNSAVAPGTPASGHIGLYSYQDSLHFKNSTGKDWNLGSLAKIDTLDSYLLKNDTIYFLHQSDLVDIRDSLKFHSDSLLMLVDSLNSYLLKNDTVYFLHQSDLVPYVPKTRTITANAPLTITGSTVSGTHVADQLKVSGHYLVHDDDEPFFYLGETAWQLFQELTLQEARAFIDDRVSKGFTAIQAVLVQASDFDDPVTHVIMPNRNGDVPLTNMDPETPNAAYFSFVADVVAYAQSVGIYMALLPCWGDRVTPDWAPAYAEIFNATNAAIYGAYLGDRFKSYTNIIWLLGGDRWPGADMAVWRAMANGIISGCSSTPIIGYHSQGIWTLTDEQYVAVMQSLVDEAWCNFPGLQSGHNDPKQPVWEWVDSVFAFTSPKPVMDLESNYEGSHLDNNPAYRRFNAYDVRMQNYRSVFAGAAGVTYGNGNIWSFYDGSEDKYDAFYPEKAWTLALDDPGAVQMGYLRNLITSRPQASRYNDQTLLTTANGAGDQYAVVATDGSTYIMVYIPTGATIGIDASVIATENVTSWWFNPTTAEVSNVITSVKSSEMEFIPATVNDWVLVIDADGVYDTYNTVNLSSNIIVGISPATQESAGSLSAIDKSKLDGIEEGANNYSHPHHSGDVFSVSDGATTIQDNVISAGHLKGTGAIKLDDGNEGNLLSSLGNGTFGWIINPGELLPTGTEGQTLYNNAGIWTANSGVYWDNANSKLGIKTTTPYYLVDAYGATSIGTCTFAGTGLDDLTLGGTFIGNYTQTLRVKIDATGTPDTFSWSIDGGTNWASTGVAITGSAQTLNYIGVTVTFANTTGHTLDDYWESTLTAIGASQSIRGYGYNLGPYGQVLLIPETYSFGAGRQVFGAGKNTGSRNTGIGYQALYDLTTGTYNTGGGTIALTNLTSGTGNSAWGYGGSGLLNIGSYNTTVGYLADYSNAIGDRNTVIGAESLYSNTASNNTAIGFRAGRYYASTSSNTTGSNSVYLGYNTRASANGNTNEIVVGYDAIGLGSNTGRWGSTAMTAHYFNGSMNFNNPTTGFPTYGDEFLTASGWTSTNWTGDWATGWDHTTDNTSALSYPDAAVIGTKYQIAYTISGRTAGSVTLAFGGQSLASITATSAFGPTATTTDNLVITPTSDFDGAIVLSIKAITAPSDVNVYLRLSGAQIRNEFRSSYASYNTIVGIDAGEYLTSGYGNSLFGYQAGAKLTSGYSNTTIGYLAGAGLTTGIYNCYQGREAGEATTSGNYNVATGFQSLTSNISGVQNSFYGHGSGAFTTANSNTGVGMYVLYSNTTGENNTAIGVNSGRYAGSGTTANATSTYGTYLGYASRAGTSGNNNETVIGYNAVGGGSNTVTLGNTSVVKTYMTGAQLKAGTTTQEPLLFNSGSLLSSPKAGAVEFLTDKWYGTITTGAARKTFAFLESPIFTGVVETPAIKITTGASAGLFLMSDGSGNTTWETVTGASYQGEIDGDNGTPLAGGSALIDSVGTAGWYYACADSGAYDYGVSPATNIVILDIGDQIYYNGSAWIRIPGAGSYTLPTLSATVKGGAKSGKSLYMTGEVLNIKNSDKGDITTSADSIWTIDNDAVTYGKIQNISDQWKVLGRSSSGAGDVEELSMNGTGKLLGEISPEVLDSLRVPLDEYGPGWSDKSSVPTKKDVYDKFESITDSIGGYLPLAGGTMVDDGKINFGTTNNWIRRYTSDMPDRLEIIINGSSGSDDFEFHDGVTTKLKYTHSSGLWDIYGSTTISGNLYVNNDAYDPDWDGRLDVPTKDAMFDALSTVTLSGLGGAPVGAKYITQTADATLSGEQALSALATGILKNTTTTGVLSIAVAGDFPTLNQNTTGIAAAATNVGITNDATTNATMYPVWVTANTGNLPAKVSSTKLTFNPSTGLLSSTGFSGALTGSVGATTPSTVVGTTITVNTGLLPDANDGAYLGTTTSSFSDLFLASGGVINWNNGDVTLTHSSNTVTLGGGNLALGANSLTITGSIASTSSRVTKGWYTDIESTNVPTVGGTAIVQDAITNGVTTRAPSQNAVYDALALKAPLASPTFSGTVNTGDSLLVALRNYDRINWNNSKRAMSENSFRDVLDTLSRVAGANYNVQFNKAGKFGADPLFYYDDAADQLWVGGVITNEVIAGEVSANYVYSDSLDLRSHMTMAYKATRPALTASRGHFWIKSSDERPRYTDDGGYDFEASLPGQAVGDNGKYLMSNGTTADWADVSLSGLGGAPVGSKYITQTADATLSGEQALSALATGILKNTTTTGVLSIAAAGDFPTLNQNTTGTAANATNVAVTNDVSTDATMYPLWVTANTGNLPAKTSSTKLSFNPSTGEMAIPSVRPGQRFASWQPIVIVTDGDSRTEGWGYNGDTVLYPYAAKLDAYYDSNVRVYNAGLSAATTSYHLDAIPVRPWMNDNAYSRVDPYYSSTAIYNIVVVWIGYNDFTFNDTETYVDDVFYNLRSYCLQRKDKGWKVIVCTDINSNQSDDVRLSFNKMIRDNWDRFADGLCDLGNKSEFGDPTSHENTTYYIDEIHLTDAGYDRIAVYVEESINNMFATDVNVSSYRQDRIFGTPNWNQLLLGSTAGTGVQNVGIVSQPYTSTDKPFGIIGASALSSTSNLVFFGYGDLTHNNAATGMAFYTAPTPTSTPIPRLLLWPDGTVQAGNTEFFGVPIAESDTVDNTFISSNLYWNGSAIKYRAKGYGGLINLSQGVWKFYTAPLGAADANASLTEVFRTGSGSTNILSISKSVSNAQIKAWHTTPVDLGIAAPGAGYAIEIMTASISLIYGGAAWTVVPSPAVIVIGNAAVPNAQFTYSYTTGTGTSTMYPCMDRLSGGQLYPNDIIEVWSGSQWSSSTTGTAKINITYRIVEL